MKEILKYLSEKEWRLKSNYELIMKRFNQLAYTSKDMNVIRAVKNYGKIFKKPLKFPHDETTYKTGRIYARYVLLPNKAIEGIYLKELIIPEKNYVFVSFDYKTSQIRHLAIEKNLIKIKEIINSDKDIYEEFAKSTGINNREQAKTILLLLNYGGSINTIDKQFELTFSEEELLKIEQIYKEWFEATEETYEEKVELSHKIQKREAKYLKGKLKGLFQKQDERYRLHAFIHDQIIIEIHKDHLYLINDIKKYLERSKDGVKMKVEVKQSDSFQF